MLKSCKRTPKVYSQTAINQDPPGYMLLNSCLPGQLWRARIASRQSGREGFVNEKADFSLLSQTVQAFCFCCQGRKSSRGEKKVSWGCEGKHFDAGCLLMRLLRACLALKLGLVGKENYLLIVIG